MLLHQDTMGVLLCFTAHNSLRKCTFCKFAPAISLEVACGKWSLATGHSAHPSIHPKLKGQQKTSPHLHPNLDAMQDQQELLGFLTYEKKITKFENLTLQGAK